MAGQEDDIWVKQGGSWSRIRNVMQKEVGVYDYALAVWIKINGAWKRVFRPNVFSITDSILASLAGGNIIVEAAPDAVLTPNVLAVTYTDSTSFNVSGGGDPPSADLVTNDLSSSKFDWEFDSSGSTDPDTPTADLEYRFDPGDGTGFSSWQSSATLNYTYSSTGSFTVIVEVRDPEDNTDTASDTVFIF